MLNSDNMARHLGVKATKKKNVSGYRHLPVQQKLYLKVRSYYTTIALRCVAALQTHGMLLH